MPHTHARRRGATVLFRRKILADLRDRFGLHEIVRSIGRATPGEARRIVHRLWSQTELVFMHVRNERHLSREEIGRVVAAAVGGFQDGIDDAISVVAPGSALPPLVEPVDQADRLRGLTALYGTMLDHNDVVDRTGAVRALASTVLGKNVEQGSTQERRLCRAVIRAVQAEVSLATAEFDRLAAYRPALSAVKVLSEIEFEADPSILAALRRAKPGDNLQQLLDLLVPATAPTEPAPAQSRKEHSTKLRNAEAQFSALWPMFSQNKVLMKEWKPTEAHAAGTTMRLWLQCCGDRRPTDYTSQDASNFHKMLKGLPSKYYHSKAYRQIYESGGVDAVIAMSQGLNINRLSDKTRNTHNSSINEFFKWCAGKGEALSKGTQSICSDGFVKVPKVPVRLNGDPSRIIYKDD